MANLFITRKFEFGDATRRNSIELHLSHGSKYVFPLIPRNLTNGIAKVFSAASNMV